MALTWITFKPKKRHSHDNYSIYIAISCSFLQAVYPVGVTDLRPYLTQIIGNNSVNVHRIPTKLGTEIRLNEPFTYAKFQPYWSTYLCFTANFAKCAKRSRRKKRRKKTQTLAARISEMAGAIFFKFGMWTPLPSRYVCSNIGFNRIRNHGATKVWKSRLLSSCKYTHGVARRLLGPHDTLPCVLIQNIKWIFLAT